MADTAENQRAKIIDITELLRKSQEESKSEIVTTRHAIQSMDNSISDSLTSIGNSVDVGFQSFADKIKVSIPESSSPVDLTKIESSLFAIRHAIQAMGNDIVDMVKKGASITTKTVTETSKKTTKAVEKSNKESTKENKKSEDNEEKNNKKTKTSSQKDQEKLATSIGNFFNLDTEKSLKNNAEQQKLLNTEYQKVEKRFDDGQLGEREKDILLGSIDEKLEALQNLETKDERKARLNREKEDITFKMNNLLTLTIWFDMFKKYKETGRWESNVYE